MDSKVCRVCLADNVRMHCMGDIGLRGLYEKVTSTKFNPDDGRPATICYICRLQLQRCHRFSEMSRRAEKMFSDLISSGIDITLEHVQAGRLLLNLETIPNLTLATTSFVSINIESAPVAVKEEPNEVEETTYYVDDIESVETGKLNIEHLLTKETSVINNDSCYCCDVCSEVFMLESNMVKHFQIHTKDMLLASNKTFSTTSNLKTHMRTHTGEKPYGCHKCKKTFNQNIHLKSHMRIHTGKRPYACKQCNKTFWKDGTLLKHMRVHTGEKPYGCKQCNKAYFRNSTLKTHMRTHTGEKPYACKQCMKTFSENSNFKRHIRTHTGEKPYACKQCNKKFFRNSTLKTHIRIHTGEKPYACKQCKKTFSQSSHFKSHMRIHTGEKPYACKQCNKTFSRKSGLQTHIQIHTGEIP